MTLTVPIISTFSDKGLKKANRAINSFAKSATRSLAAGFSALAIERFAAASIKAFVADDLAAKKLAKTLGNLGMAYEATNVKNFIQGLEKTYHIADDLLRPAFAKLLQVTGSYTKSKEMLTTALNASSGAGVDLTTTVQDLSQAYVGNLRGLRKYNLGLTKAELATMSYQQIQDKLNSTFAGQGLLAASSYSRQIDALSIAANNAKEIIGKGLVNALTNAAGKKGDIQDLVDLMMKLAQYTSNVVGALGQVAADFNSTAPSTTKFGAILNYANQRKPKVPYNPMSGNTPGLSADAIKIAQARAKQDKEAAQRQKDLANLTKKQLKLESERTAAKKAQAALDKANRALDFAGTIFDLDKIQLYAALQGKITQEDRDKLTLKLLLLNAENQTGEALNKSAAEATRLSEKILMQNGLVMTYDGMIKNLATAKNPFEGFDAYTKGVLEQIRQIQLALDALKMPTLSGGITNNTALIPGYIPVMPGPGAPALPGASGSNYGPGFTGGVGNPTGILSMMPTNNGLGGASGNTFTSGSIGGVGNPMGNYSTVINVNANWVANPQEVQDAVQTALQIASRSGNSTNYAGGA